MSYCFKTSLHPPQTARVSVCCQNPNKQICINLSPCHYSCSVKIVSRLPTRCFVMDSSVKSVCLIQRGEILVGHFGHDQRIPPGTGCQQSQHSDHCHLILSLAFHILIHRPDQQYSYNSPQASSQTSQFVLDMTFLLQDDN